MKLMFCFILRENKDVVNYEFVLKQRSSYDDSFTRGMPKNIPTVFPGGLVLWSCCCRLKGKMVAMVLDVVELPESHSGLNLAIAFQQILHDFGIEHKVSQ